MFGDVFSSAPSDRAAELRWPVFRALELMGGAGVAPPLRVGQEASDGFSDLSLLHGFRVWVTSTTFLPADK